MKYKSIQMVLLLKHNMPNPRMDMKKTAQAPSNIAFVKYWGKKDEKLRLPANANISMNLSNLNTVTTVEFDPSLKTDAVSITDNQEEKAISKVVRHLDRIRNVAHISLYAKVISRNNFPSSTGLSSSASSFAALTLAASCSAGLSLNEKELSIMARLGSGSACRSIPDGFTEWLEGEDTNSSYAVSLLPASHFDIVDIVAIVSNEKKEIPTTEGHALAQTSPFYQTRLTHIKSKIIQCKKFLHKKNFTALGELIEKEALEMHAIMITSSPPLIYWLPTTVSLMKQVQTWRKTGLECYFTINTGQDIHIICRSKDKERVKEKLQSIKEVKRIIVNIASKGAHLISDHLF